MQQAHTIDACGWCVTQHMARRITGNSGSRAAYKKH
jgi:hypothetical protein